MTGPFKPTLCLDFDGVVHSYEHGWQDGRIYGTVTPGFFEWMEKAAAQFRLVIYSSRSLTTASINEMRDWLEDQYKAYSLQYAGGGRPMPPLEWARTKPPAWLTIDDRALTFDGDWSHFEPTKLRAFKPWTQQR